MKLLNNIFLFTCISSMFLLHPSMNKGNNFITKIQHYVYGNPFNVIANSDIDFEYLKVTWSSLETNSKEILIYAFGKQINEIPSVSGTQKFRVFYKGKEVGKIVQNKTAAKQSHNYTFNVSTKNGAVFFRGEIEGPSSVKSPATTTLPIASL